MMNGCDRRTLGMAVAGIAVAIALVSASGKGLRAQTDSTPLYGVTIDNPWDTESTVKALASLSRYVTARIVFDEQESARDYDGIVQPLAAVADLMGEILDSAYVRRFTVARFQQRVNDYLNTWGRLVKIWEICNECNGEWLGRTNDVVAKM